MKEVLVARREDEFSRTLIENGLSVINCPVIRTEPLEDLSRLENALSRLDVFDGVFITSSAAAEILVANVQAELGAYRGRVFVLGRRSFDILKQTAANVVFDGAVNTASDMLDAIDADELRGKRFLFIRGERSMRTIPERLSRIADVEELIVYRTVNEIAAVDQKEAIRKKAANKEIAIACFFSPSGIESFVEQFGIDTLRFAPIAVIGETTAAALQTFGLTADVTAGKTDSESFAADVLRFLKPAAKGV
jgi:uroporphyrinogen-III synthase